MNYTKPEIAIFGQAVEVIEQHPQIKQPTGLVECACSRYLNPAYDLDE